MLLHNDLMRGHVDLVMLRRTTGSYERPVIKVAYGKILFHSTEAVWELIAMEEWLRCRHDTSPMFDIPGSTLVWAQYLLFSDFQRYKNLYVLYFQIYIYWWTLTSSWPDEVQRIFSTAHEF